MERSHCLQGYPPKEDVSGILDMQAVDQAGRVFAGVFGIGPGVADQAEEVTFKVDGAATEQAYYRGRKDDSSLSVDQARRLKEVEKR